MSEEYLLILPIPRMNVGDSFKKDEPLPLHCTLMHWFIPEDHFSTRRIADKVELICKQLSKATVKLVGEERGFFGPNDDVPVTVLSRNADLNFLHTSFLIKLVEERAVMRELRWVGAGYRAHVADVTGAALGAGSVCECDCLALISRDDTKMKKVLRIYPLGQWAH